MNDELKYAEELIKALRCNCTSCHGTNCNSCNSCEYSHSEYLDGTVVDDMRDAADMIEALTAENAELREAQEHSNSSTKKQGIIGEDCVCANCIYQIEGRKADRDKCKHGITAINGCGCYRPLPGPPQKGPTL